jgi:signal transduction histidine kinase
VLGDATDGRWSAFVRSTNALAGWALRLGRRAGTASRLAGLQALVLAAVLTASVVALLRTTAVGVDDIAIGQLDVEMQSYQHAAATRPPGTALKAFSTSYLRTEAVLQGNLVEVSVPGSWAVANAGGSAIAADSKVKGLAGSHPTKTEVADRKIAGRDAEVLVAPIRTLSGPPGVFVATVDLTALKPAGDAAVRLAIGEAGIALIAGVASAYLLLRRLLRRVGRITDTAERIGRDRLEERLGDQGTSDEVGRLATSFDSMLDRIQAAVSAQHELLSDVSHQLRTPLTVARGHLEVLDRTGPSDEAALRETIAVAVAELDQMDALVERFLILGRAREPVRRDAHDVDLRSFFGDFVRSLHVLADRQWLLDPVPDGVVRFDETEVRGALLNLVDNSVGVTRSGDVVAIVVRLTPLRLLITVEDSGPGVSAADRDLVLDRFARPGRAEKAGTGLGLAIVSAVCRAHGGTVTIGDSALGGASVTMSLSRHLEQQGD